MYCWHLGYMCKFLPAFLFSWLNNYEPVNTLNASLLLIFSFILALSFLFLLFRSYLFDLVIDDMIAWNPISFYCFSQAWSLADGMLRLSKRCVHFPLCFFWSIWRYCRSEFAFSILCYFVLQVYLVFFRTWFVLFVCRILSRTVYLVHVIVFWIYLIYLFHVRFVLFVWWLYCLIIYLHADF